MSLEEIYQQFCKTRSDINEHLPILSSYAKGKIVTEFGVRKGVSTTALLRGRPKKLISYDINIKRFNLNIMEAAKIEKINFSLIQADVLKIEIEPTDILFIDTLHTYEQLSQELAIHSEKVSDALILHDTTTFKYQGETKNSKGLNDAIQEFIANGIWKIKKEYINNNGLTILERL